MEILLPAVVAGRGGVVPPPRLTRRRGALQGGGDRRLRLWLRRCRERGFPAGRQSALLRFLER